MEFVSEATNYFYLSLASVDTLVQFAKNEDKNNNFENRALFLKLSIVLMVTRFQVFVESILDEFKSFIIKNKYPISSFPIHFRLNSLRLISRENNLEKTLENYESYSSEKFEKLKQHVNLLNRHFCAENFDSEFKLKTKYPLGKAGSKDLIDLFRQIEGIDIFDENVIDIRKLDSILTKRHLIVHQDIDPQLSDFEILDYKCYLVELSKHIEIYLNSFLKNMRLL